MFPPRVAAPFVHVKDLLRLGVGGRVDERDRVRIAGGDVQRALALIDQPFAAGNRVIAAHGEATNQPALHREQQPLIVLPSLVGHRVEISIVLANGRVDQTQLAALIERIGAVGEGLTTGGTWGGRCRPSR